MILRKPKKSKASGNFANMMQPPQSSTGELSDYTKDLTAVASQVLLILLLDVRKNFTHDSGFES